MQVVGGEQDGHFLEDIVAISAGNVHVLALDKNNNVWAWGEGWLGQLGDGTATQRDTPVRVETAADTPLTDIVYIYAGYRHSTAIDKYGDFWVWGDNVTGQLGLGDDYYQIDQLYAQKMP